MPVERDYILRVIEMMVQLIAAILGRVSAGKFDEAEQMLENAYQVLLREEASLLRSIPAERLIPELLEAHSYTHGQLEVLAELFLAQAQLHYARMLREESLGCYDRSIILFRYLETESRTLSFERLAKIQRIEGRIAELKD